MQFFQLIHEKNDIDIEFYFNYMKFVYRHIIYIESLCRYQIKIIYFKKF